jgi:hypothetical protein
VAGQRPSLDRRKQTRTGASPSAEAVVAASSGDHVRSLRHTRTYGDDRGAFAGDMEDAPQARRGTTRVAWVERAPQVRIADGRADREVGSGHKRLDAPAGSMHLLKNAPSHRFGLSQSCYHIAPFSSAAVALLARPESLAAIAPLRRHARSLTGDSTRIADPVQDPPARVRGAAEHCGRLRNQARARHDHYPITELLRRTQGKAFGEKAAHQPSRLIAPATTEQLPIRGSCLSGEKNLHWLQLLPSCW